VVDPEAVPRVIAKRAIDSKIFARLDDVQLGLVVEGVVVNRGPHLDAFVFDANFAEPVPMGPGGETIVKVRT
jgi:hypothetical protein